MACVHTVPHVSEMERCGTICRYSASGSVARAQIAPSSPGTASAYTRLGILSPTVRVAKALHDARRRAGLTQSELAERAGTSQAAISAYESAAKEPSVSTLSRLLVAAGARLTVEPARVLEPSAAQHARAARALLDVLELAEALPTRHEPDLRFPRLPAPPPR